MSLRDRIIETALTLFDEKGYHGVSVNEIVQKANTSKGGFYYHFTSKEELLFVIHDVFITHALDKVKEADQAYDNYGEKLEVFIKEILKVFHLYKSHITVFYEESKYLRSEDRQIIKRKRAALKQVLINVIHEGKLKQQFRSEINTEITVMAILGMLNWVYKWYKKDGIYTIEEIGNYYVDLILHSTLTQENIEHLVK